MCVATMRSVTLAMKAKRMLQQQGIYADVVNVDGKLTKYGCTYGVSFSCVYTEKVRELLQSHRMDFGEIMGENRV